MAANIAIIGAGVSALTCGVLLAEKGRKVTLLADETGPATTSAVAGAIWYPYDAEAKERVVGWALETYRTLQRFCHDPGSGVRMIELRTLARDRFIQVPEWAAELGARPLSSLTMGFASGFSVMVPLLDTTVYLDALARRLIAAGGVIRGNCHLTSLGDVPPEFDGIVLCAGLGAGPLAQDRDLEPHRGQVAVVAKFDLPYAVVCDDPPLMYAMPRSADCLFGGTNEVSADLAVDSDVTTRIMGECSRVLGVPAPVVLAEKVGLRPFRKSGVRLEKEESLDGRPVVHNYGHGGSGFTLSWGCAREVAELLGVS